MVPMLKAALPLYDEYLDQHGLDGALHLLQPLEDAILQELQRSMGDQHAGKSSDERARTILKLAQEIAAERSKAARPEQS